MICKGKIKWFDSIIGEGILQLETGLSMHLHFTSISSWDKSNILTPSEVDRDRNITGRECFVALQVDGIFKHIEMVELI